MTNIWGFWVQTLTVSLVTALLLLVKHLLANHLSPRWQYGVWGVLAARILLPVSMANPVLLPVPLWIETWKSAAEQTLHSAFVCGVVRPVLVLPADTETDEKVLLHELLHLKYRDALQSVLWCVLRALHWCNPLLQLVCNRIGNDMESLCDQRVLEKLEGEERREYGGILLAMANDRYPRAPGTTSVSNGGTNIARRITAIVRFKKYPKGMGLVSVCTVFVLGFSVLTGTAAAYPSNAYHPDAGTALHRAMAISRTQRCTTLAGALDTYAKGLLYENGVYIAMASPLRRQEELAAEMHANAEAENWVAYHLDSGYELEQISPSDGYAIYNLSAQKDGSYTALLVFFVTSFLNPDGEGLWKNEVGENYAGSVAVPVTVHQHHLWRRRHSRTKKRPCSAPCRIRCEDLLEPRGGGGL